MTREEATCVVELVIQVIQSYSDSDVVAKSLKFLLGELRDLELERNKHELDAAHWKERYEDAVRALEQVNTVTGQVR